jgi:predicted nucleic acid-binding protein
MIRVVDASAVAALLFGEPDGPWVHSRISGPALIVPAVFHFELGNVCRMKSRRHPESAAVFLDAWLDWNIQPPVTAMAIDLAATMELAGALNLTFYDASYLWLAQHQGGELISLDAELVRAARNSGVSAPLPAPRNQTTPRSRH